MHQIGLDNWTMKLLEYAVVDNLTELRQLEQKWINKENPNNLLNIRKAFYSTEDSNLDGEFQSLNLND